MVIHSTVLMSFSVVHCHCVAVLMLTISFSFVDNDADVGALCGRPYKRGDAAQVDGAGRGGGKVRAISLTQYVNIIIWLM